MTDEELAILAQLNDLAKNDVKGVAPAKKAPQPFGPGILGKAAEAASGVNKGLLSTLDIPSKFVTLPMQALGMDVINDPFTEMGRMLGGVPPQGQDTWMSRLTEPAGAAAIPMAGLQSYAARQIPAATTPLLSSINKNPAGYRLTEMIPALTGGVGASVGGEVGGETGAAIGGLGGSVMPTVGSLVTKGMAVGGPNQQRAMRSAIQDAEGVGVQPTAGTTGSRRAAAAETLTSNLPIAAGIRDRRMIESAERVGQRVDEIADTPGLTNEGIGRVIQRGIGSDEPGRATGWMGRWSGRVERLFNDLGARLGPGARVAPNRAIQRLREVTTPDPSAPLSTEIDINPRLVDRLGALVADAEAGGGTISYDAFRRIRTRIGRMIGSPMLHPDEDTQALRSVYAAMSQDMEEAARQAGPEALAAFGRGNREFQRGMTFIDDTLQKIRDKNYAENVGAMFNAATKKGPSFLREMKRVLTPDEFNVLRGQVLRDAARASSGSQAADEVRTSVDTFITNWDKMRKAGTLNVLFGGSEWSAYRRNVDQVVRVAGRIKDAAKVAANRSGTGQTNVKVGLFAPAAWKASQGDIGGAGQALLLPLLASTVGAGTVSLMQSPAFVRWLAQSTRMPVAQMPYQLEALAKLAAKSGDPVEQDEMKDYAEKLQAIIDEQAQQ